MLPFLKPKRASETIMVSNGEEKKEGEAPSRLMSIAEKLISHVHAKDAAGVADCLEKLEAKAEASDG